MNKHDVVQVKNPKTGHYVKIDRTEGKIISHKKSDGPYKDIPAVNNQTSDSWQTPDWLFKHLDEEFHFDIDLCATKENSKCERYCSDYLKGEVSYTFDDSTKGKEIIWDLVENAFMNPPYSNPKPFIEKAWEDSKHCKIICLVKCDPSTRWWATFWDYGTITDNGYGHKFLTRGPKPGCEVRFFPKRIKFDPPPGWEGKTSGPTFPCALIIMDRRDIS